jgi:hypothetical protein
MGRIDEDFWSTIEDTSLTEWLTNSSPEKFDEEMDQYLKNDKLRHYKGMEVSKKGAAGKKQGSGQNNYGDYDETKNPYEIELNMYRESMYTHWTKIENGSVIRHETLPPLNEVDFSKALSHKYTQKKEEIQMKLVQQKESEPEKKEVEDW